MKLLSLPIPPTVCLLTPSSIRLVGLRRKFKDYLNKQLVSQSILSNEGGSEMALAFVVHTSTRNLYFSEQTPIQRS
jgi:hypothetical protein